MPAVNSESIAICLPGIASRLNLAATSAILPEPFVITIKLIIVSTKNIVIPTIMLSFMTNLPKDSITLPAELSPKCPFANINLVDATFNASLINVVINKRVGKIFRSSGL